MPEKFSCSGCGQGFSTQAEKIAHERDCEMVQKKATTKKK
jgi:hypothetical protein